MHCGMLTCLQIAVNGLFCLVLAHRDPPIYHDCMHSRRLLFLRTGKAAASPGSAAMALVA
jgi:hypothetical protein